jgi:hypothetical protein
MHHTPAPIEMQEQRKYLRDVPDPVPLAHILHWLKQISPENRHSSSQSEY